MEVGQGDAVVGGEKRLKFKWPIVHKQDLGDMRKRNEYSELGLEGMK